MQFASYIAAIALPLVTMGLEDVQSLRWFMIPLMGRGHSFMQHEELRATFLTAGCILFDTNFSTAFSAASKRVLSSLESASPGSFFFCWTVLVAADLYFELRASRAA